MNCAFSKIWLSLIIVILIIGGFFYWWQKQTDVRELNKTLPEGIKVEKGLFGEGYKVVNNIDDYEFRIPPEWKGVKEINRVVTGDGYPGSSISLEGNKGIAKVMIIERVKTEESDIDLKLWVEERLKNLDSVGDLSKSVIGKTKVIKTQKIYIQ
ncbi:hypothetical protein J7K44_02015 [bacterium]|nr:hypothetical protein [bacterium]